MVSAECAGIFDEVIAGDGEGFAAAEADSMVFDGVGAVVLAREILCIVRGVIGVAVVREGVFGSGCKSEILIAELIGPKAAAGEDVFEDVVAGVGGDLHGGESKVGRGGAKVVDNFFWGVGREEFVH